MTDAGVRTIRFATQHHPIMAGMETFARIIDVKSEGRMMVSLFRGDVLGGDESKISALQSGTIQMLSINSGILSSLVREFAIYDFPFLFANAQEAYAVLDGSFGELMHTKLIEKGIVGLAYWDLGFRCFTNSQRSIQNVEDFAGLKLRVVATAVNIDWVQALKATPVPLAFPEVYPALERRMIDGQENPLAVIDAWKFFEVQKHLTLTNHQYSPQSVVISKKFWETLSGDEKMIISGAATESTKIQRKASRVQAGIALDNLKRKGMQVVEFNATEMTEFRDAVKPVIDKYTTIVGVEAMEVLGTMLIEVRAQALMKSVFQPS